MELDTTEIAEEIAETVKTVGTESPDLIDEIRAVLNQYL
jgi:hypothetical protein